MFQPKYHYVDGYSKNLFLGMIISFALFNLHNAIFITYFAGKILNL